MKKQSKFSKLLKDLRSEEQDLKHEAESVQLGLEKINNLLNASAPILRGGYPKYKKLLSQRLFFLKREIFITDELLKIKPRWHDLVLSRDRDNFCTIKKENVKNV